jgi:hypothetical protein
MRAANRIVFAKQTQVIFSHHSGDVALNRSLSSPNGDEMYRYSRILQSLAIGTLEFLMASNVWAQHDTREHDSTASPASAAATTDAKDNVSNVRDTVPTVTKTETSPGEAALPKTTVAVAPGTSTTDAKPQVVVAAPKTGEAPVTGVGTNAVSPVVQKAPPGPNPLESGPPAVKAKWNTSLYGFLILDTAHDSTQSFQNGAINYGIVARPGTWAGDHGRTSFDARFTRIGFRLAAPEVEGIKASAFIEFDFAGNQAIAYPNSATYVAESGYYNNPVPRLLNFFAKVENPYVDAYAGLYYHLYGGGVYFGPLSVQLGPIPGTAITRASQVRLSKTFKNEDVSFDIAVAASRPVERDSQYPDGEGSLRLLINHWKAVAGFGGLGAYEESAGFAISGIYRKFRVPDFVANPTSRHGQTGRGLAVNALIPVISRTAKAKGNALTLLGTFTTGTGIGDTYPINGGAYFPALPNPSNATPAPNWGWGTTSAQDVDNGLVTYDPQGRLRTIDWTTYAVGAQYYLPPTGRVWLSTNYAYIKSGNLAELGLSPTRVIPKYNFWDACVFYEITPAVPAITGLEYSELKETYADGVSAKNKRFQLSFYYSFY